MNNRSCSRILGFHPSTIGRELLRGAALTSNGYDVRIARVRARRLRTAANQQHRKLHDEQAYRITELLGHYYSPDQAGQAVGLSHATVYCWLWAQSKVFIASMWQFLRHDFVVSMVLSAGKNSVCSRKSTGLTSGRKPSTTECSTDTGREIQFEATSTAATLSRL